MVETAAHLHCKPEVNFTAKNWTVDGKPWLKLSRTSLQKPHFAPGKDDNGCFIRIKDEK
jgi:nicotinic acid phosphoribosyltransferase